MLHIKRKRGIRQIVCTPENIHYQDKIISVFIFYRNHAGIDFWATLCVTRDMFTSFVLLTCVSRARVVYDDRVGRVERLAVGREPFGRGLGPGGAGGLRPPPSHVAASARGRIGPPSSQGTGAAQARGLGAGGGRGRAAAAAAASAAAGRRFSPARVRATGVGGPRSDVLPQ